MKHIGAKIMSLLCLALLFTLLPGAGAYAETISGVSYQYYVDAAAAIAGTPSPGTADCTKVESSTSAVTWNSGWYVVSEDATINVTDTRIEVNGEVNLILVDGKTLTANQGIHVGPDATLNIYAQSTGTGKLIANGFSGGAGIGGASKEDGGTITIHGGTVRATGGEDYGGAGIGGGMGGAGGTITIHGGAVTGTGKRDGAGIGGGPSGAGGTITINGGTVTATSIKARYTSSGAGIGSGYQGAGGTITINRGTVNATGGEEGGAGIGSGYKGANVTVIINDGEVTATGGKKGGAGIGGGNEGAGGTVIINDGEVTATGGEYGGAGIGGGGNEGAGGDITINGGTVNATGGQRCAGIGGGGLLSAGGNVTITGGTVKASGGRSGAGIGGGLAGESGTVTLGNGMLVWAGAGENPQKDNKNIALSFETTHSQRYVYAEMHAPIITGADLVLNGSLDLRFYVALPKGFDGSGAYMSFTIPGRNPETGTTGRTVNVNFADADNAADGQKIFPCPVYSIEMAKTINAAFRYGESSSVEKDYSVQEYLDTFNDGDGAYALAVAAKNYGHYMQPYLAGVHNFTVGVDYREMPAGSTITAPVAASELSSYERVQHKTNYNTSNLEAVGYFLTLNEDTTLNIQLSFKSAPNAVNATATANNGAKTVTSNVNRLNSTTYRIEIPNIAANNLGATNHVTITADGTTVYDVDISALSYVYAVLSANRGSEPENLALTALYNYYVAARDYN